MKRARIMRGKIVFSAGVLLLALAGCGESGTPSGGAGCELQVFAAASMQESLEQIVENYREIAPDVAVSLNLDSSGTLKTQIAEGAVCDVFLSAAQKQMDQLDFTAGEAANPDGLDFIDSDTRIDLLENKVVLVVPDGNPKGIASFEEIAEKAELISLGNDDVPVGQYSKEILTNLGVLEALQTGGKITYGSNVKEVATQVSEGIVDCGIVYATDASSAGLEIVDEAEAGQCRPVVYPAAVLKSSQYPKEARAFLAYLQSEEAAAVFEEIGFSPLG